MKCVFLIVLLAAAAQASLVPRIATRPPIAGAPVYPNPRIVNGEQATRGQFPHQAGVLIDGSGFCGGSLIHARWVLTAGHCAIGASTWDVTLGQQQRSANEPGRVTLRTTTGIVHDGYNSVFLYNDVALLQLPSEVELTEFIQLVTLPTRSDVPNQYAGDDVTASGWGKDSDASTSVTDQLNFVNLNVITNTECAQTYGALTINAGKICCGAPGGISVCNGDSGGPLVKYENSVPKLVGVVSFVSSAGCASGAPSGYARVTTHLDWLENNSDVVILP